MSLGLREGQLNDGSSINAQELELWEIANSKEVVGMVYVGQEEMEYRNFQIFLSVWISGKRYYCQVGNEWKTGFSKQARE